MFPFLWEESRDMILKHVFIVDITMNDPDEFTAVLEIKRHFSEFVSGASRSSVASKLSFEGKLRRSCSVCSVCCKFCNTVL